MWMLWLHKRQKKKKERQAFVLFFFFSQGEFSAIIELPEGEHEYKFCVDGRWIHDPNAVSEIFCIDSFGVHR